MFVEIKTLLDGCASLAVSITSIENGLLNVTLIPVPKKGEEGNGALNTPLSLTGTAEELDQEFVQLVTGFSESRKSLTEQLESTQAILDAAKKESQTKATKAITGKSGKGAASAKPEPDDGEDDGDDETGSAAAATSVPATPAAVAASNLFD